MTVLKVATYFFGVLLVGNMVSCGDDKSQVPHQSSTISETSDQRHEGTLDRMATHRQAALDRMETHRQAALDRH